MDMNTVANIAITLATSFPTQAGFGIPLLVGWHDKTPNRTDEYTSIKALEDDGFTAVHPIHRMATLAFSQNPKPKKVVVGKRLLKPEMIVVLTVKNATEGFVYRFTFVDHLGAETEIEYTVLAAATTTTVAAAIELLIEPLVDVSSATVANAITITAGTPGNLFDIKDLPKMADLEVEETTADPGIATDLSAIEVDDPATWYCLFLDSNSKAQAVAAAAWTETRRKLHGYNTSDSECADNAVTDDVFSALKAANYTRSIGMFTANRIRSYACVGWISKMLAVSGQRPGSVNWAYQEVNGATVDTNKNLTDGQESKIHAKNGNTYTFLGGQNDTFWGKVASGIYADLMHGRDWLHARMQETVKGTLHNASNNGSKVPFTQKGLALVGALLQGILDTGVRNNFLAETPVPTVTVPLLADIAPADRAERHATGFEFSAVVAGAINTIDASGVLEV